MKKSSINYSFVLLFLAMGCNPSYAERADRNKPVHLEADHVSIDDAKQISTFEGKVLLTQGTMAIQGDKVIVVQDKNGFSHGTATGEFASFRQKREGFDEYLEGYGQRIEYNTQTETVDFYGQARMIRRQDEVRGDHITYNSRTEIFQVQSDSSQPADVSSGKGRVHVTLQPKPNVSPAPSEPVTITPLDQLSQPKGVQ
jgi:lipopolysaccharide export system protein LptA